MRTSFAGSLNFTTSSKANEEFGLMARLPAAHEAVADWRFSFEDVWSKGATLEESLPEEGRRNRIRGGSSSSGLVGADSVAAQAPPDGPARSQILTA